jgi:type I restriction enzyme S subunit
LDFRPLADVATPVDAKITTRKDPTKPYVGLENIPSRGTHLLGWEPASASISTNSIFHAGDVLFGKLRPNLRKCVIAPFDGYCSTDILVLRANDGIDGGFAGKVLRTESVGAFAVKTSVGTKMPRTSWKQLSTLGVFCPGQPEQVRISQVLDTIDIAIQGTEAIIAKLKAVKEGLLHDLMTRGIDASGELRPPQAEAPHLYKDSPLGWIPREWNWKSVVEIADIKSGATPARDMAHRYFAGAGFPWVKTLDLNEDLIYATDETITQQALRETSCSQLPAGTVLVAMYGGWEQIGRTGLLGVSAATNQAISALVFRSDETVSEFVLRALQHGRPRWQKVAASTRKDPNITKADVLGFQMPFPEPGEQAEIARRIRCALDRLWLEAGALNKLRNSKSGLMDDLLTGRVRVTPLLAQLEQPSLEGGG